eukprot:3740864-Prymnesium_polylepis.1
MPRGVINRVGADHHEVKSTDKYLDGEMRHKYCNLTPFQPKVGFFSVACNPAVAESVRGLL